MKNARILTFSMVAGGLFGLASLAIAEDPIDDPNEHTSNLCKDVCQKECDTGVDHCTCNAGSDCVEF